MQANPLATLPSSREVKLQAVSGLSVRELARVRGRLVEFTGEMFGSMRRKDQRRWGECYVRGLMLDGKRKSTSRWRRDWRMGMSSVCSSS